MDRMQATPRIRPFVGGLADMLAASSSPERTQQMQGLMQFLQVPDIAQTLDRISYGEPITTGRGMTTSLRPEAKSTLGALLGLVPMGRAAEPAAVATGRALEPVAGRVAEAAYNRGGLAREMAMAMGQGTQSKIFIGPDAKTWDKDAAMRAVNMERQGATPQEIWAATGTARGPDKMWRQEIDDSATAFRDPQAIEGMRASTQERISELRQQVRPDRSGQRDLFPKQLTEARRPIRSEISELDQAVNRNYGLASDPKWMGNFAPIAYDNPALYQAYPDLRRVVVRQGRDKGSDWYGGYAPLPTGEPGALDVYRASFGREGGPRSTAAHEMQHAIQEIERFGVGGNTRDFARMRGEALDQIQGLNDQMTALVRRMDDPATTAATKAELKKQYDDLMAQRDVIRPNAQIDPYEAYRHLMGESEARLVQRRLDLTPEQRRQNFPFQFTGETGLGFDVDPTRMILMTPEGQIKERGLLGSIGR
jgi:hypothetical protein